MYEQQEQEQAGGGGVTKWRGERVGTYPIPLAPRTRDQAVKEAVSNIVTRLERDLRYATANYQLAHRTAHKTQTRWRETWQLEGTVLALTRQLEVMRELLSNLESADREEAEAL
jgi:hypothetical protein